jgi:ribosome maturation factor RimP
MRSTAPLFGSGRVSEVPVELFAATSEVAVQASEQLNVELLDARMTGHPPSQKLSLIVDIVGGIGSDACVALSHQFDVLWEARTASRRDFGLDVSSPGPKRVLENERDFALVAGRSVEVSYRASSDADADSSVVTGTVESCTGGVLYLVDGDDRTDVPLDAVNKAKLVYAVGAKKSPKQKSTRRTRS